MGDFWAPNYRVREKQVYWSIEHKGMCFTATLRDRTAARLCNESQMETLGNIGLDRPRCTLPHEKADDPGISMVMRVVDVPGVIVLFSRSYEKENRLL